MVIYNRGDTGSKGEGSKKGEITDFYLSSLLSLKDKRLWGVLSYHYFLCSVTCAYCINTGVGERHFAVVSRIDELSYGIVYPICFSSVFHVQGSAYYENTFVIIRNRICIRGFGLKLGNKIDILGYGYCARIGDVAVIPANKLISGVRCGC